MTTLLRALILALLPIAVIALLLASAAHHAHSTAPIPAPGPTPEPTSTTPPTDAPVSGPATVLSTTSTSTTSSSTIPRTTSTLKGWQRCNNGACNTPINYAALAAAAERPPADSMPAQLRRIGGCESSGSPTGPLVWTAHNSGSTASGAFEDLDSTWQAWERQWGTDRVARAMYASPEEQIRVNEAAYAADGTSPWNASRACWG